MSKRSESNPKRALFEKLMAQGVVTVYLDPSIKGVELPDTVHRGPFVCLNFSPRFNPPDLLTDALGVRQTLSFSGRQHSVMVPWSAIFTIRGNARDPVTSLFPDSMPSELRQELELPQPLHEPKQAEQAEAPETDDEPFVATRGAARAIKPPRGNRSPRLPARPRLVACEMGEEQKGGAPTEEGVRPEPVAKPAAKLVAKPSARPSAIGQAEPPSTAPRPPGRRVGHLTVVK